MRRTGTSHRRTTMRLNEHDDDHSSTSDEAFSTDGSDSASAGPPRAHQGAVYSHYDPSRTKKLYAKKSQVLQKWVKELWDRFCLLRGQDPVQMLHAFRAPDLYDFLHWMLSQRRGRIRKASTVQTYWNTLTLVRQLVTKQFDVPPKIQVEMCGARQNLVKEFGLSTDKEAKPIMRAEDEFELLKTLWESAEVVMQHERQRVQLALMIQLAGITGNRPGALRGMQYKDLKIALLPDPAGGDRPRLVIDFTFRHTKRYLRSKDPNTFPVPDIPQETCLLLCPQTMLLGLLFADNAFAAPDLTPAYLFELQIPDGKRELEIPIDPSKAELPLFRRTERTVDGITMSDQPVTENWLRERLRPLGNITNFDWTVKPYCFRRGHGEALDSSSHISDSQRNLIMQHANSTVFQHNYLSHYVTQDTQAAYRGLAPQTAVMRVASGMSRSIDPRRPRALTGEQLAIVDRRPEVILARRLRDGAAKHARALHTTITRSHGTEAYQAYVRAQRNYLRTKQEMRNSMLKQIKADYRTRQPVADIQRQIQQRKMGQSSNDQKTTGNPAANLSPERQRVLAALLTFSTLAAASNHNPRVEAIDAVQALCGVQEESTRRPPRYGNGSDHDPPQTHTRTTKLDRSESRSDPFPTRCTPTQCIFCMGNDALPLGQRAKAFRNKDGLKRHLFRKHLKYHTAGQRIQCPHPKCSDTWLEHADHLRNHAALVHNTTT